MITVLKRYKFVVRDVDRHGRVRHYFRRAGQRKLCLRNAPGTPEFDIEYQSALATSEAGVLDHERAYGNPGRTYRWLCQQYFQSADYKQLDLGTQRTRRLILQHTWDEPVSPGSKVLIGNCPLDRLSAKIVRVLRDRKTDLPNAANSRVKILRRVLKWAVENELVASNPARDVPYLRVRGSGYHTLTEVEIQRFEDRWPVGTKERLAFALLRYLGVRRSDVVRIGKQHLRNGWLSFTTKKGDTRPGLYPDFDALSPRSSGFGSDDDATRSSQSEAISGLGSAGQELARH